MTTSQTLRDDLDAVLDQHDASVRRHRDSVDQGLLTEAGHADAVSRDSRAGGWMTKIGAVRSALDSLEASAAAAVKRETDAIYTPAGGSAAEQLLAESRAVRAWERLKVSLDQQSPVGAEIDGLQAVQVAVGDERRVVAEELPAYLVGRDIKGANLEALTRSVRDAIASVVPSFAAALAYEKELAPTVSYLRTFADRVQRTVESNVPGGHRDAILRAATVDSFPTPPTPAARPDSRTPEEKARDAAAVDAAFARFH
ncbi:hypothetical protein [Microbacterium sp. SA39]|uniref:hypothetical protein n=1 Tax=Microbacterium sp. SA39 TaxID=1263625 RepID=UPI0005FA3689|nr:hypothetical protein [Microbacterium sp. SA39]KJQ54149.1 hypothetical protein RS85_02220 [Microbacterium sp. SA39]